MSVPRNRGRRNIVQVAAFSDKIIKAHRGSSQSVHLFWERIPRKLLNRRRDGRVAEGARLESVFTRKANVGSNPTLSVSKSELQRNCPTAFREIRERCPFSASFAPETGLERADCGMNQSRVSRVFSG